MIINKINEQGKISRLDDANIQGALVNESEIISTGAIKIDIQQLSDTVFKEVKLFEVRADEIGNRASTNEVGMLVLGFNFRIGSFDFKVF